MDFRRSKSVFSKKQKKIGRPWKVKKRSLFLGPPIVYVKMSRQLGTVLVQKKPIFLLNTDFDPLKSILLPPCRKSIREAYTGSRLRDFETSRLRDFDISRLRDFETSRLRDFETSRLRDFETSRLRDFETSRLRDFDTSRKLKRRRKPWPCRQKRRCRCNRSGRRPKKTIKNDEN